MFNRFFNTALSVTVTLITAAAANPASANTATVASRGQVGCVKFLSLDKTWTSGRPRNKHGSQLLVRKAVTSRVSLPAERTGFEPATSRS